VKGSLIIEKMMDPMLRQQWEGKIARLGKALKELEEARKNWDNDPTHMEYFEAVMQVAAARDDERNFYWENFYELRTVNPDDTIRINVKK